MRYNRFDMTPSANKFSLGLLALCLMALLSACGKESPPEPVTKLEERVSFQTLESNRATAQANAEFNAQKYRAENPRFEEGFKIVGHTDSTITNDCPQGDGWATISIMKVQGKEIEKYTVKCSTVSGSLGCYLDNDFQKKPFGKDDGQCQPQDKVPFPLPKLVK